MNLGHEDVIKTALRFGWELEPTDGGHVRLHRSGCAPIITSKTARDVRAGKNLYAQLRRSERAAGIIDGLEGERRERLGKDRPDDDEEEPSASPSMPAVKHTPAAQKFAAPYADLAPQYQVRVEIDELRDEVERRERYKWEPDKILIIRNAAKRLRRHNTLEKVADAAMALLDGHVELMANCDPLAMALLEQLQKLITIGAEA